LKSEELETKVKVNIVETVKKLEVKAHQDGYDIEAIKKLQRAYGYYLEHWQEDQIIDLWSPTATMSNWRYMILDGYQRGYEAVAGKFPFLADH